MEIDSSEREKRRGKERETESHGQDLGEVFLCPIEELLKCTFKCLNVDVDSERATNKVQMKK